METASKPTVEEQLDEFFQQHGCRNIVQSQDMTREEKIGYLLALTQFTFDNNPVASHWTHAALLKVLRQRIPDLKIADETRDAND